MLSIILPTRKRHKRLQSILNNIEETTDMGYELIIVADRDDPESQEIAKSTKSRLLISDPENQAIEKWNFGAKIAVGDWLFICSDDIVLPLNWLSRAYATPNTGFIGLPDQKNPLGLGFTPFYMAKRSWLKAYNNRVLVIPHYKTWGCDVETCERASRVNQYAVADLVITHNHLIWGLAESDESYQRGQANWERDLQVLNLRRANGYPNDFEGYL
jgi:glycosyltransferase involved in cell wall biosynthesis